MERGFKDSRAGTARINPRHTAQEAEGTARILRTGYNRARIQAMGGVRRVLTGIGRALRARPALFVGVGAAVLALDILVPVAVLSLARVRVDYFTFNPWLGNLPGDLASGKGSLAERVRRARGVGPFWFSADGGFGLDWGFPVAPAQLG